MIITIDFRRPSKIYYYYFNSFNLFPEKIEALEDKIKTEMSTLKEKMAKMNDEMDIFTDLDR